MRLLSTQTVKSILKAPVGKNVEVNGWIRSCRAQKTVTFAIVNDGTSVTGLQAVLAGKLTKEGLTTGTSVRLCGVLTNSPGKEQNKELHVTEIEILGECDGDVSI